jgi:hypothetical protein
MSVPGFILFLIFGIYLRFRGGPALDSSRFAAFDWPLLTLAILSFSDVYAVVGLLPLPFLERVSSRFLIIPVSFLVVFAAVRMQRAFEAMADRPRLLTKFGVSAALGVTAYFLHLHSQEYSIWHLQETVREGSTEPMGVPVPVPDFAVRYGIPLAISVLITLAACAAWIYCYRRPEVAEPIYTKTEALLRKTPVVRLLFADKKGDSHGPPVGVEG